MKRIRQTCLCTVAAVVLANAAGCAPDGPSEQPRSTATTVLVNGPPSKGGLDEARLTRIDDLMAEGIRQGAFPGAVVLVARHGVVVKDTAYGNAAEFTDDHFHRMPQPVSMKPDTLFDLASLSKLFTTLAVMKLYDQGKLGLDDPVSKYVPAFSANGKAGITVRMLLTHTSGLQSGIPLLQAGKTTDSRIAAVMQVKPHNKPGTQYEYSDLNFIVLGVLVERISGKPLAQFVRDNITDPLSMHDTMYNPPASLKMRIAANEYQPSLGRGLVWGQVEDENAWSLGGVAGHAGVFSTAHDLAVMAQMLLNGGVYNGHRILSARTVQEMEHTQTLAGHEHALGFELNQEWYMGNLASSGTLGHTGFSGTSIVIDTKNDLICILLTNRVHPTRNGPSINSFRSGLANLVSDAVLSYGP